MPSDYIDFDLEINSRGGGKYEIRGRSKLAGEATPRPIVEINVDALTRRLTAMPGLVRGDPATRAAVLEDPAGAVDAAPELETLGAALYDAVMVDTVAERYLVSLEKAADRDLGLRIRLTIQAPEVAALPWEFMFDRRRNAFVGLSSKTPIVRYIEVGKPPRALKITPPLRVLGIMSGPEGLAKLDKQAEKERIETSLAELQKEGRVELTWIEAGTLDAIQTALTRGPWHVVHYIGHGSEGVLMLENDQGKPDPTSARLLGTLFDGHGLRLIVLNSCEGALSDRQDVFSSTAGKLLESGIPAVVAMQYPITDNAAVTFAQTFYKSIATGEPVDSALSRSRLKLSRAPQSAEWGTPVLFMRSDDGELFTTDTFEAPPRAAAPVVSTVSPDAPAALGRRSLRAAIGGALAASVASLGALATFRTSVAAFSADFTASHVALRVGTDVDLSDAIGVRQLLASSMEEASVPLGRVRGVESTGSLLVSAMNIEVKPVSSGNGKVTLEFPGLSIKSGSRIELSSTGAPAEYRFRFLGDLPPIPVSLIGATEFRVEPEPPTVRTFESAARLSLIATHAPDPHGVVTLDFIPAAGSSGGLLRGLPIDSVSFFRIDQADMRAEGTLGAGTLRWNSGRARSLTSADTVRLHDIAARIRQVTLANDSVQVSLSGTIRGLSGRIAGQSGANLMPTYLEMWPRSRLAMSVSAAAVVGAAIGMAAMILWRKRRMA